MWRIYIYLFTTFGKLTTTKIHYYVKLITPPIKFTMSFNIFYAPLLRNSPFRNLPLLRNSPQKIQNAIYVVNFFLFTFWGMLGIVVNLYLYIHHTGKATTVLAKLIQNYEKLITAQSKKWPHHLNFFIHLSWESHHLEIHHYLETQHTSKNSKRHLFSKFLFIHILSLYFLIHHTWKTHHCIIEIHHYKKLTNPQNKKIPHHLIHLSWETHHYRETHHTSKNSNAIYVVIVFLFTFWGMIGIVVNLYLFTTLGKPTTFKTHHYEKLTTPHSKKLPRHLIFFIHHSWETLHSEINHYRETHHNPNNLSRH